MISNGSVRGTEAPQVLRHGSSLHRSGQDSLDGERAASMADEGGTSGALTDALEQAGSNVRDLPTHRRASTMPRWLPWVMASVGVFAAVLTLFRRR
ncbi:MAG: hypothetical protein RL701_500 [Pseudomonadota bacterium]|jgi:hypothetical protein